VLNESDVEAKAISVVECMDWIIDMSLRHLHDAIAIRIDQTWRFEDKCQELWDGLLSPQSLLTMVEANYIYQHLHYESLKKILIDDVLLRDTIKFAKKLLIMWDIVDNQNSDEVFDALVTCFQEVKQQQSYGSNDSEESTYVSTEECYQVLESATFLRLSKVQLTFLLYWSDAFEKGDIFLYSVLYVILNYGSHLPIDGNIIKYRRFVEFVADAIVSSFRNIDFLKTFYKLFAQGVAMMKVERSCLYLTETSLLRFLDDDFDNRDDKGNGAMSRRVAEGVLHSVPSIRLNKDEVSVILSIFGTDKRGALEFKEFKPSSYLTISCLLMSRYIGRRLSLVYSGPIDSEGDTMEFINTLPLKKLAERLLHVVKVVAQEESVELSLPDHVSFDYRSTYSLEAKVTAGREIEKMVDLDCVLPVVGHPTIYQIPARLSCRIDATSWGSQISAEVTARSMLLEEGKEGEEPLEPLPLMLGLPSTAGVDPDEAEMFLSSIVDGFYIAYDDRHYSYLCMRLPSQSDDALGRDDYYDSTGRSRFKLLI
jgi:hypothetical protein